VKFICIQKRHFVFCPVVRVQFTENSYRANETQLRMPVRVTKNREIATPLVVQVTPMNVSAVIDTGLPLPASELPPENALEPNRATCEMCADSNFYCKNNPEERNP